MPAFYINSVEKFLSDNTNEIVGALTRKAGNTGFYQQLHTQTISWGDEIDILKNTFQQLKEISPSVLSWGILLEYPIARRSKRIDAIIINNSIQVLEFKIGKTGYTNADEAQLIDYCLDLRDFHFESRNKKIYPILVASESKDVKTNDVTSDEQIESITYANKTSLCNFFKNLILHTGTSQIDYRKWNDSAYSPTPNIIEAAQALYQGQSVVEISRSHAGAKNLSKTSNAVIAAINEAREKNEKIICFITGVPGAGKTLAGLNIAHHADFQNESGSKATFLSGNGPLIQVLREALARDAYQKAKGSSKKKEKERAIAFIENVHRFLDAYFFDKHKLPNNHIVIFDEAQRAWNAKQSEVKFKRPFSEAEMLFDIMQRHNDWAVIVALIGGGQEINTGEAGLPEWGKVLKEKYSNWKVYISNELHVGNHSTGNLTLFDASPGNVTIVEDADLHLNVPLRSYKAEALSKWVNLVLNNNPMEAQQVFETGLTDYEIVITRELEIARNWLTNRTKGSRRMGLVASSGARRLRPYGLDVKTEFDAANWFLNPKDDIRSSCFLEVPATEFGIQGLELDWIGLCWDSDLRRHAENWDYKNFSGTKWQTIKVESEKNFVLNTYRVLLTRAREGMVLWVPHGNSDDLTRLPEFYDPIFEYLKSCGVKEI